jgi:hypothetical protein
LLPQGGRHRSNSACSTGTRTRRNSDADALCSRNAEPSAPHNDASNPNQKAILSQKIIALAKTHKFKVALFSQEQVRQTFFADGKGTKHALAEILAKRFPEELGSRLPQKRKPWMSEH